MSESAMEGGRPRWAWYARSFWGLFLRDGRVLLREFIRLILQSAVQPLLFFFIFTYVFPKIGQGFSGGSPRASFATILVPGFLAVSIFFAGISSVALPLATELGRNGEIEDRIMAPVPIWLVGMEKVTFSAVQGIISAAIVLPIAYLVPAGGVSLHVHDWPLLVAVVLLASFTAGSLGLALGTVIKPQQIGLLFGIIVTPLIFLGCVYYPWANLQPVRWLQIVILLNPLVYVSEGLRAALTPQVHHMPPWAFLGALSALLIGLTAFGLRSFYRRVVT
ncbi:ABC transporter permease [Rubrobacter calidifluminis]|uniref:ABC transporter permease n=1 Tax=Rubrobacter calidifluminis TaxID=1392640 RepID=UPI0023620C94|nr:ABC transporter permease [Rubrobacter calidifluminis]